MESMRADTGSNPAARACVTDSPVCAMARPQTLTIMVPRMPGKRSRTPAALAPATRPILLAVVPSGTYAGQPVIRFVVSAQSPAAKTPARFVCMWSFDADAPRASALDAGFGGELDIRPNAVGQDHQVGAQAASAVTPVCSSM